MSRRIASIPTAVACLLLLAGCKTTEGQTQDVVSATVGSPGTTGSVVAPGGQGAAFAPNEDFAAAVAAIASNPGSGVRQVGSVPVVAMAPPQAPVNFPAAVPMAPSVPMQSGIAAAVAAPPMAMPAAMQAPAPLAPAPVAQVSAGPVFAQPPAIERFDPQPLATEQKRIRRF